MFHLTIRRIMNSLTNTKVTATRYSNQVSTRVGIAGGG